MRRELMTWHAGSKRWFKKYRGNRLAISCRQLGVGETKEASREAANEWFEKKRAELDGAPLLPPKIIGLKELSAIKDGSMSWPKDGMTLDLGELAPYMFGEKPFPEDFARAFQERVDATIDDLVASGPKEKSVRVQTKLFLDRKEAQVVAGQRSPGRFEAIRCHLQIFSEWFGAERSIESIDGSVLEGFHTYLMKSSQYSSIYRKDIFSCVKQFIRWAWGLGLIDLPRNIDSREFRFDVALKSIKTITKAEIKRLLDGANESMRLFLLLMLNAGMQQSDISDLKQSEVDWKKGRIKRKRSKTEKHTDVPEVNYLLWPETFRLLKKHRSSDPLSVLLTARGKPLVQRFLLEGKIKNCDNIKSAYRRLLRDTLKLPKDEWKPLKLIRKTSSSLLGNHKEFSRFAQYFLAHSPKTVADRHYVRPSEEQFDEAIKWLGESLGITKRKSRS